MPEYRNDMVSVGVGVDGHNCRLRVRATFARRCDSSPRTEQEKHEATKTKTHRIVDNPLNGDENSQAAHYDNNMW